MGLARRLEAAEGRRTARDGGGDGGIGTACRGSVNDRLDGACHLAPGGCWVVM
jgi:hypothetical protein